MIVLAVKVDPYYGEDKTKAQGGKLPVTGDALPLQYLPLFKTPPFIFKFICSHPTTRPYDTLLKNSSYLFRLGLRVFYLFPQLAADKEVTCVGLVTGLIYGTCQLVLDEGPEAPSTLWLTFY